MRFSAVTALCTAPLALAGSMDMFARRANAVDASVATQESSELLSGSSNSKGSSKANNNNNGNNGNNVIVQQSTSITEVIIIWVNNGGNAATTTINTPAALAGGAAAAAATHTVIVGGAAGLVYSPDQIIAAVGDMVVFTFMSNNHTATQSAFTTPCKALAGGMDSGFMPNVNNTVTPAPQMAMQVTVATPIWFYCRQAGHCGKGMTFAINPTANKTEAMFKSMAIAQNGTGTAAAIAGGAPAASASVAAASPAAAAATGAAAGTMVAGTGTTASGGACTCSCLCGVAAFPNAAIQGIGGFGGLSGSMPMSALEA